MMRDDEPLDLSALHSEAPLTEFDYAAIRARVHSKLAERRRFFPLFLRVAFAAMVIAVIAILVTPPKPRTPVIASVVERPGRQGGTVIEAPTPPGPSLTLGMTETKVAEAPVKPRPKPKRKPEPKPQIELAKQEPMRIEIQTADPDVRIIWIVQSETPTENS